MFLIISDLHQGLTRKTGVTPESLEQFESDKIKDLAKLLDNNYDKEVIIAGDLFDSHRVSLHSVLEVATTLLNHPKKVWVVAGNHDLSKNTLKMSSLLFMSEWMKMHSTNVEVIFDPIKLGNMLLVPHMPNQELFDIVVANSAEADILITHCNYENNFAVEKDHSLNLTKKQASKFKMVISGHEHNKRSVGNVHMLGSFAPCNVGEASVEKFSHLLDVENLSLIVVRTPEQEDHYAYEEVHWKNIKNDLSITGFLKVTGEATAAEAPTVLSWVANRRKQSLATCYMIQNAVTVESIMLGEIEGASFDSLNTMELLGGILDDKYKNRLEELGYVID